MSDEHIKKMIALVEHLKAGHKGKAEELAEQLDVCRSSIFRYMDELRSYGAEIVYCKCTQTFSLKNDFDFLKAFSQSLMN